MLILRTTLALITTTVTLSFMSVNSFAFYHAQSETISNAFSLSRVLSITLNPGSGSGDISAVSLVLNNNAALPNNSFTKLGYHFGGWSTSSAGSALSDASELAALSDDKTKLTLYALWTPNSYTVSFKDNVTGGSVPDAVICTYDKQSSLPSYNASADDMLFLGWNTKADGSGTLLSPSSSLYNLSDADGALITLYAVWEDESGGLIETNWTKRLDNDSDNNGTPDRFELKSGSRVIKDPSVKNLTDNACYAYIAVHVPTVTALLSGDASESVHDIAILNTTTHWKLIKSEISSTDSADSVYIYRYDTVLKAHGCSELSSNHTLRHADRSTDLMSSFTIQNFSTCPAKSDSVNIKALLIEAIVTESEADELALLNF